jgi:DNA mismatch endonuclease (patch repair protein)
MQSNRSRDTGPEMALRRLLFAQGLRYRVAYKPLKSKRTTVDVAFTKARLIIQVDGCFWHGCPEHYRLPKTNTEYWQAKIERNQARDAAATAALQEAGWEVLRFWEHEDPSKVAALVAEALAARRAAL